MPGNCEVCGAVDPGCRSIPSHSRRTPMPPAGLKSISMLGFSVPDRYMESDVLSNRVYPVTATSGIFGGPLGSQRSGERKERRDLG